MNGNDVVLLCPQVYSNLLPSSASSRPDYYTSKVTTIVSVTLTVTDIQGADLSEPLVLFWHCHWENTCNKLVTATLSWLSFIPITLSDLALLSRSLRNQVEGGAQILAPVVVTTCYMCPGVLCCSRSYLNQFSLFSYHC